MQIPHENEPRAFLNVQTVIQNIIYYISVMAFYCINKLLYKCWFLNQQLCNKKNGQLDSLMCGPWREARLQNEVWGSPSIPQENGGGWWLKALICLSVMRLLYLVSTLCIKDRWSSICITPSLWLQNGTCSWDGLPWIGGDRGWWFGCWRLGILCQK